MQGYIWAHRSLLTHKYFQNEKLFKVMMYCLLKASHTQHDVLIGLQTVELNPGQFVFGRSKASIELNMNASTVWKYFKVLESERFIDIKSNNKFSVVTVVNWCLYQAKDSKDDSKNDNKITTKRQQNDTYNNVKNEKIKDIVEYLNKKASKNYRFSSAKTNKHINARIEEGYTIDDFKKVINTKVAEWIGTDMEQYIRPETLFGSKFESYLNQKVNQTKPRLNIVTNEMKEYRP